MHASPQVPPLFVQPVDNMHAVPVGHIPPLLVLDFAEDFFPHCEAPVAPLGHAHAPLLQHSAVPIKQSGFGGEQLPLDEDAGTELFLDVVLLLFPVELAVQAHSKDPYTHWLF